MIRRLRHRHVEPETDINVTAFMNLMVVLVPFLLVMAVFSRVSILELELPEDGAASAEASSPELDLEVIVRDSGLLVADRVSGERRQIGVAGDGYDLEGLAAYLKELKSRHPNTVNATILLEPDITYENLIAVMDTVRVTPVERNGEWVSAELFPDIAVGEVPQAETGGGGS